MHFGRITDAVLETSLKVLIMQGEVGVVWTKVVTGEVVRSGILDVIADLKVEDPQLPVPLPQKFVNANLWESCFSILFWDRGGNVACREKCK